MPNVCERSTPCGAILGTGCQWPGVTAYKGIRYAAAGRWEYPKPVTHWDGVYDATEYGACSYQPRAFYNEAEMPEKAFYYHEFREGERYAYSEDCLFLNIWTPTDAAPGDKLPVLFYIHGGGFTGGCGHEKHFDGPVWPTKGVIAVTINYRLGPLGFACLPELEAEAGHTGNYALFDQLTALQWVRDNIAAFGGDAENITIMGQSAGGFSVQQLCLSPLTEGMFAKAVMSSGAGVNKMMSVKGPGASFAFWQEVMARAGCADLAAFRALPPKKLFEVWNTAKKEIKGGGQACAPVLDGRFLVETGVETLAAGRQRRIPYMAGCNSQDVMPPFIYKMAMDWCRAQETPGYMWFFDRQLPGDKNGAWHSSDLWYWFGTLDNGWRPWTERDRQLSEQMVGYLTAFAKTGKPDPAGLPAWQNAGGGKALCLGEKDPHMGRPGMAKLIFTMLTNKAVGE